ncbi:MAG: AsnC family transcriptional regulator [Muribaculaceae bacterium]|nr:AsnC family transcriptional regulator [Muribaculaceae bacterium]
MAPRFDKLDISILRALSENARTPYLEIARETGVSGAAVHQRVQRLMASKVIVGSQCLIDPSAVGFDVVAYLGINAMASTDVEELVEGLQQIEEVTECHIVAGRYDVIVKLHAKNNEQMLNLIQERMRPLKIASTETMVSFREAFHRPVPIGKSK